MSETASQPLIPKQRPHYSYVIIQTFKLGAAIIIPLVIGVFGGLMGSDFVATISSSETTGMVIAGAITLGILVVTFGLIAIWSYLSWKRFWWEVENDELHISSGIIFKKDEHIAITKIHSIDHKQSLIERILGVVELRVTNAAGSTQREAHIEGVTLAEAEHMSRTIFARKYEIEQGSSAAIADRSSTPSAEGVPSAATSAKGALQQSQDDLAADIARMSSSVRGVFGGSGYAEKTLFEYHLTTKDLVLTGLSNSNVLYFLIVIPAVIFGFLTEIGITDAVIEYALQLSIIFVIVAFVAAFIIGWIVSTLQSILSYAGFTVKRLENRVEIERGLIERHSLSISLKRVQTVRVTQGLLRRFIGYAEVSVETVQGISTEGEVNKAAVVHPFIKMKDVDSFLSELLPEFAHRPEPLNPLPRRALFRAIFRTTFWTALCLVPILIIVFTNVSPVQTAEAQVVRGAAVGATILLLAVCVFCGAALFKARKWGMDENMIAIQKGLLGHDISYISKSKVQWVRLSETYFQKRQDLATFTVLTAAGAPGSGTSTKLVDMTKDDAERAVMWAWPPMANQTSPDVGTQ